MSKLFSIEALLISIPPKTPPESEIELTIQLTFAPALHETLQWKANGSVRIYPVPPPPKLPKLAIAIDSSNSQSVTVEIGLNGATVSSKDLDPSTLIKDSYEVEAGGHKIAIVAQSTNA